MLPAPQGRSRIVMGISGYRTGLCGWSGGGQLRPVGSKAQQSGNSAEVEQKYLGLEIF